jgi:hypothetical protein
MTFIDCPICGDVYSDKRSHCPVCGHDRVYECTIKTIGYAWELGPFLVVAHGAERARQCPQSTRFIIRSIDES